MKLVENWALWWCKASSWLAALNGLFVSYVFSQPMLVLGLLGFVPGAWLLPLAALLGLLAFGLPVLVAHIAQPKLQARIEHAHAARIAGEAGDGAV